MKKVAYFTNIAPHYREQLWLKILESNDKDFHFFFGEPSKNGIKPIDFNKKEWNNYLLKIHKLKNFKIRNRLIFQLGVLKSILFKKWDVCIFLGDPNLISNWIGSIIARLIGVKVIFWGHGLYGSEFGVNLAIRKIFLKISNVNLVYGNWAKDKMLEIGFEESKINVIYNSLDYDFSFHQRKISIEEHFYFRMKIFFNSNPTLIFIGRLTKQKKVHIILQALNELKMEGENYNLMIIGEGPEKEMLISLSKKYNLNIFFYGSCYEESIISKFISNADLCVSPGNVGLTAIHSLSYGTPVCTHNDFTKQMPEIEAIIDGETGCLFSLEKLNLKETISIWFSKNHNRDNLREKCYKIIDSYYNPHNQSKIISNTINQVFIKK